MRGVAWKLNNSNRLKKLNQFKRSQARSSPALAANLNGTSTVCPSSMRAAQTPCKLLKQKSRPSRKNHAGNAIRQCHAPSYAFLHQRSCAVIDAYRDSSRKIRLNVLARHLFVIGESRRQRRWQGSDYGSAMNSVLVEIYQRRKCSYK